MYTNRRYIYIYLAPIYIAANKSSERMRHTKEINANGRESTQNVISGISGGHEARNQNLLT